MNKSDRSGSGTLLIVLAYVGFISLGLPDAVIGVAWPSVRNAFHLPQGAAGLVFVSSGFGYFITSFYSGRLTHTLGIGLLLTASTALVFTAMLGFAFSPVWVLFVAFALVHGLGSGAIDAGLNGYAAHNLSVRHMNWLHACYCFGAMLGPLVMTAVLSSGRYYRSGYLVVAGVMATLSVLFLVTMPRWKQTHAKAESVAGRAEPGKAIWHSAVLLQMGVFFVYTGLESALSQWAFTVLTELRGVAPAAAGVAVAIYWGSIGLGRVAFGLIADRVGIDRLLRCCLLIAASGVAIFAVPLGPATAYVGLALAGIGLAPVFPCLMIRTPQRLGTELSTHAVGFQVGSAMIGAAAVPGLLGVIANEVGLVAIPGGTLLLSGLLWLLHEILIQRPDAVAASGSTPSRASS